MSDKTPNARKKTTAPLRDEDDAEDEDEIDVEQEKRDKRERRPRINLKRANPAAKNGDEDESNDEDDEDDEEDEEDDDDDKATIRNRSSGAQNGFVANYLDEAKNILTSPKAFFKKMPTKGGFLQPTVFLMVSALVFALLQAISKLNFFVLFTAMFSSILNVLVASAVLSLACKKMGGKGSFEGTYRVIAYSKATLLFAWLSLGPIPAGGIASLAYGVYLNIIGLEKVQKMPRKSLATLIIVVALIGFALKLRFGI